MDLIADLDTIAAAIVLPMFISYVVFGFDDFVLDIVAWIKGFYAGRFETAEPRSAPEKKIAIAIAGWKEDDVIGAMVRGNQSAIEYSNYEFFVGVYPNDLPTVNVARDLAEEFSNVFVVINSKAGPTSKGQMLNEVMKAIVDAEKARNIAFDCVLIHDCEDIIHPRSLSEINRALDDSDFVQVPVLSLPVPVTQLVAGTYMDEFAEVHSKDLRIRSHLTGALPAAGVGMAMSRSLLQYYLDTGDVFNEKSLTEDYELGIRVNEMGGRGKILYLAHDNELIATREYFPKTMRTAIRQKTRWTTGIAFQGWRNLGWRGSLLERYFLYRDRKGPVASILSVIGLLLAIYLGSRSIFGSLQLHPESTMRSFAWITVVFMINRIFQRWYACFKLYGFSAALLSPLRIFMSNWVNACAACRAVYQYTKSRIFGGTIQWAKTTHELPIGFGVPAKKISSWILALTLGFASHANASRCIQIFYDQPNFEYTAGEISAVMLENLLGHFPSRTAIRVPVEKYHAGLIERCSANFYVGSYFDNALPQTFLDDIARTQKPFAWLGYSLWKYSSDQQQALFGISYSHLASLDWERRDADGRPSFFRDIRYKGETFSKYGEFADGKFLAAPEIAVVRASTANILAEAVHNGNQSRIPYVTQKANRFFIADVPFSYIHESDRYLVFADVLFDIIGERPQHQNRPAIFRLEDVHSRVPSNLVLRAGDIAKEFAVPMQVALIPVFTDPFGAYGPAQDSWLPLDRDPDFLNTLKVLQKNGVGFIWHGVTHQLNDHKNPSGAAGDDWEFWDYTANSPVASDSVSWVLQRLNSGWTALKSSGIEAQVWEVPHYQASALDYFIFGRVFSWNIGRISYQAFSVSGLPERTADLLFERTGTNGHANREKALQNLSVSTRGYTAGQFFPYPIFRDAYGQRVFPENLGYVELPQGGETKLRTVDDILRDARRNLVLRDVWGSFFFHPFILNQPGGEAELRRLLKSMKEMGYQFIDLKDYTKR